MRGTFLEVESVDKTHKVDYSIVGINYCSAEYLKGVEYAADSLRKASFRYGNADGSSLPIKVFSPERGYILQNTNLADYGNIEVSSESDLILKLKNLDLSQLGTSIFIGGDHAITYYTVDRIQKERNSKPIIVFQFDAHSDYIDEFADYPHGSVMCETSRIDGVEKIIHFGLRGNLNCGPALLESKRHGNIIIPYKDIKMMFNKVLGELKDKDIPITELIMMLLEKTGYVESLKRENTIEAQSRIENLEEFMTVAIEFEKESADTSLNEFLNSISLSSDTDNIEESDDMVTLMTLHMAKGLEYPVVFLVGLEEGIFPGRLSMDNPQEIEEERRLFYVGITRAKQNLFMTFAKHRTIFGSTSYNPVSRFVKEIPQDCLDNYDDAMQIRDEEERFEDSEFEWSYSRKPSISHTIETKTVTPFGRSADSFLKSLQSKPKQDVDVSKYKIGQEVFHKKFGEGIITNLEQEGDDIKVDIEFKKAGHKRLMARFAGLEIIE